MGSRFAVMVFLKRAKTAIVVQPIRKNVNLVSIKCVIKSLILNVECCNAITCKYIEGANCDSNAGPCCENCQLKQAGTICRKSTSDCDLPEFCRGNNNIINLMRF